MQTWTEEKKQKCKVNLYRMNIAACVLIDRRALGWHPSRLLLSSRCAFHTKVLLDHIWTYREPQMTTNHRPHQNLSSTEVTYEDLHNSSEKKERRLGWEIRRTGMCWRSGPCVFSKEGRRGFHVVTVGPLTAVVQYSSMEKHWKNCANYFYTWNVRKTSLNRRQ